MSLTVFLPTALALTFEEVTIIVDDVNLFVFTYVSKGDGKLRKAKFFTKNMVGYAVSGKD